MCIDQRYLKVHRFCVWKKNSKVIEDELSEEAFVRTRWQPSPVWTKILNYWQKKKKITVKALTHRMLMKQTSQKYKVFGSKLFTSAKFDTSLQQKHRKTHFCKTFDRTLQRLFFFFWYTHPLENSKREFLLLIVELKLHYGRCWTYFMMSVEALLQMLALKMRGCILSLYLIHILSRRSLFMTFLAIRVNVKGTSS